MQYHCLIYFDPKVAFSGSPESNAVLAEIGPHSEALKASGHLVTSFPLNLPQEAITVYQQMLASNNSGVNQWQLYLALSQLYAQTGDAGQARTYGQLALQNVPATDTASQKTVQDWLKQLH